MASGLRLTVIQSQKQNRAVKVSTLVCKVYNNELPGGGANDDMQDGNSYANGKSLSSPHRKYAIARKLGINDAMLFQGTFHQNYNISLKKSYLLHVKSGIIGMSDQDGSMDRVGLYASTSILDTSP